MDVRDQRELHRGMGDSLSRAFEIAATMGIFGALGWFIDGRAGTRPVFMILLVVACAIGQFVKLWYLYDAEMRRHEAELPVRGVDRRSTSGFGR